MPHKQVQAVPLLLGGRDVPTSVPANDVIFDSNRKVFLQSTASMLFLIVIRLLFHALL